MSWANKTRRAVHWLCYFSGASVFQARRQVGMRVIKFHGVDGEEYRTEVFEAQLEFLKRHFSIVRLESIVKRAADENGSTCNDIALTFDDGLRNHYTIVYPILQRLKIPATFFVCPGLIDSGRWLWNHEARERLRILRAERRAALARELQASASGVEELVTWMKTLPVDARNSVEEAIRRATPEYEPTARQRSQYDVMSWKELSSIDSSLVTIGSHTVTHPILTTLTAGELSYEICESRRWLEEKLKRPIEHFCYPNGAFNEAVLTCVRNCYRSAVNSVAGKVTPGEDLHSLRRINTARQLPLLAWRLHRKAA
jgi:peptidoglycan/xylan/chitin deacetylase (PgdA/CDA1 family)